VAAAAEVPLVAVLAAPIKHALITPLRQLSDICRMQSHVRTDLANLAALEKSTEFSHNIEQMSSFTNS
jgi:hypothetical protein